MPHARLARFILLPDLKFVSSRRISPSKTLIYAEKISDFEVCPKCASKSERIYDHRMVTIRDAPIRGVQVELQIRKRRFFCDCCKKPFTEPVNGIGKSKRFTQRFRSSLLWACETFADLKKVRRGYQCSTWTVYQALYEQLRLKVKQNINYPWPETLGIDEHFFRRDPKHYTREFATIFVDYENKRVRELARGRSRAEIEVQIKSVEGRERVKNVVIDLSGGYKSFVKNFFPNAQITADKFHVLRLFSPTINRMRKEITGDVRRNPVRKLLLRNNCNLEPYQRRALAAWLKHHPDIAEVYSYKEAIHRFYRIKGAKVAHTVLVSLINQMAKSKIKEIRTMRNTLRSWKNEILNYFKTGLTNARTEGFNNVAKLVQKRAYGVKSFENYRLRLLNACA